jgi:hypothetical protein
MEVIGYTILYSIVAIALFFFLVGIVELFKHHLLNGLLGITIGSVILFCLIRNGWF